MSFRPKWRNLILVISINQSDSSTFSGLSLYLTLPKAEDGVFLSNILIYLPEIPFSTDKFLADVDKKMKENNGKCMVVISEGIADEKGTLIAEKINESRKVFPANK